MRAILMAAGKGTRISRMVADIPKSTLPINGEPLIRRTVKLLQKFKIECTVCVGYRKEKIYEALSGLDVDYCVNPFYNVTNSIASLWFARAYVQGDMLLLNADVFFTEDILTLLLRDARSAVLAIDKSRVEEGDYFFKTTDNGCITKYGKDLPLEERSCEYVGMCKLQSEFCQAFVQRMEQLIDQAQYGLWWENILYSFTDECEIYTIDVRGKFWAEIDYFDDYERILKYIETQQNLRGE